MTHPNQRLNGCLQQTGQACFARHVPGFGLWLCAAPESFKCRYNSGLLGDFCKHPDRRNFCQPLPENPPAEHASVDNRDKPHTVKRVVFTMQLQELHDKLEVWLRRAQEHSEIPAAEADWRVNLLKVAQQFDTCEDLVGTQTEEYMRMAAQIAKTGNAASFDLVRELLQRVLADIRSGRVQ
ncbi:MAG TPA: hypothetical protein VMP11_18550 [Verrucomicrobiae bacterium]|nr:hypothetical protein [Verrucomicrobiae bacterium]